MPIEEIVAGQQHRWSLVNKLGEGDAGEVFLVNSLLGARQAILKRPRRTALASDTMRQANQIKNEGLILKALEKMAISTDGVCVRTPSLLDRNPSQSDFGAEVFIVVSPASGFDLQTLFRLARSGLANTPVDPVEGTPPGVQPFLKHLADRGALPELLLLRVLHGLLSFNEKIHSTEINVNGERGSGLIWNDVKPEHLYWDPLQGCLTIIDWGNAQFLEADGGTKDRLYSQQDDDYQILQEMGRFIAEACPDLYARLAWPVEVSPGSVKPDLLSRLKEQVAGILEQMLADLRQARREEADLAFLPQPGLEAQRRLDALQSKLRDGGEIPDQQVAEKLYTRLAAQLASEQQLVEFKEICRLARLLVQARSPEQYAKWSLLADLAVFIEQNQVAGQQAAFSALQAGAAGDWPSFLWESLVATRSGPLPDWWDHFAQRARHLHLGASDEVLAPYLAASRTFFTLQANFLRLSDVGSNSAQNPPGTVSSAPAHLQPVENLLRTLDEEVIKKWKDIEPDPPNAGIEYNALESLFAEIDGLLPGARANLEKSLDQPKAQTNIVMDAWRRQEFETARRGLRLLLLWDPHRRRVLAADRAISTAQKWLLQIRAGTRKDQSLQDFLTQVELSGRDLRSQVGPAPWLEAILTALKELRSGARVADLIMAHPELLNTLPWLNEYRSRETLNLPHARPLTLEPDHNATQPVQTLRGMQEASLGPDGELSLAGSLDTWMPEARGSSARVFSASVRDRAGKVHQLALKILRPDKVEYALPLFREEARILTLLRDVPGVTRLVECGFLRLAEGQKLPPDHKNASARQLRADVQRFGMDAVQNFLTVLEDRTGQGWLPYLALEIRKPEHNLIAYCDAGYNRGQFLPLREGLLLGVQICDILQVAHDRNIAYRDHKILHYYWDPLTHGVATIDWNIAKRYPQGLPAAEKRFDLVQFGARALHHILTGRAATGSLPLGPNLLQEIEQAAPNYQVQWTYDDERLPNSIKEILERVLGEGYSQVKDLRQDLLQLYQQMPED